MASAGVLLPNGYVEEIRCEDVECGFLHTVDWREDPVVPTYYCDTTNHLYRLTLEEATSWLVSFDALAEALAKSLGAGRVTSSTPDVRRLGTLAIGSKARDVFLVRGNNHGDADKTGVFADDVVIAIADRIASVGIDAGVVLLASEVCSLDATGVHLDVDIVRHAMSGLTPMRSAPKYLFRRMGDYWEVSFGGDPIKLEHSLGLKYIKFLIDNRAKEFHALNLVLQVKCGIVPNAAYSAMSDGEMADSGLIVTARPLDYALMDRKYRRESIRLLSEARIKLETAARRNDVPLVEVLNEEIALHRRMLDEATDGNGRSRSFSDEAENARVSVIGAVKTVRLKLESGLPDLFDHFEKFLKTATTCQYLSPDDLDWQT